MSEKQNYENTYFPEPKSYINSPVVRVTRHYGTGIDAESRISTKKTIFEVQDGLHFRQEIRERGRSGDRSDERGEPWSSGRSLKRTGVHPDHPVTYQRSSALRRTRPRLNRPNRTIQTHQCDICTTCMKSLCT